MKRLAFSLWLSLALVAGGDEQAGTIHKRLDAETAKLAVWTRDAALVKAVMAQNQRKTPMEEILLRDEAWRAGKDEALVTAVTKGPCADRLGEIGKRSSLYSEIFLMDDQGALVCATGHPSDYWQGDEEKWTLSFAAGAGATFIDTPSLDESTKKRLAHVSLPLRDGHRVIGVLTVGILVDAIKPR